MNTHGSEWHGTARSALVGCCRPGTSTSSVRRCGVWARGVVLLTAGWIASNLAVAGYVFTDLGTLGGTLSGALAINNSGQVVGFALTSGDTRSHATVWTGAAATNLSPEHLNNTNANGINDAGQVVGQSAVAVSSYWFGRASVWNGSALTVLGALPDTTHSEAYAINNAGQVVGGSIVNPFSGRYHATLWNGVTPIDLGVDSIAYAINDVGQVAGQRNRNGPHGGVGTHATVWTDTEVIQLDSLGGNRSGAWAINDSGVVAGDSFLLGDASYHATIWHGTVATDLGTLGGSMSSAMAINNIEHAVGWSTTVGDGLAHATMWIDETAIDLNSLLDAHAVAAGWHLSYARGINDSGWITGTATNSLTGESHAYILVPTAVPEPVGHVLVLTAMAALWLTSRGRKDSTGGARQRTVHLASIRHCDE